MTRYPLISALLFVSLTAFSHAQSADERAAALLQRMTPEEKAAMLAGGGWMESRAIPRLGIPAIKMADGPLGVRNWTGSSAVTNRKDNQLRATAFPSGVALAASWDAAMAAAVGQAVAQETKALGRDMILGPTVNINRVPLWGRNFEGFGEDPFLAGRLAVAWVKAVQQEGVIPAVKHFDANNEEFERHRIDETIDERTLQEIYLPAFKAAVQEAGAWAVMSAYNKVDGQWCSENEFLLRDTLQRGWGFQGFVISDWGSTYSTEGPIKAGMNLEMPGGDPLHVWLRDKSTQEAGNEGGWLEAPKVLAALAAGKVTQAEIDDGVRRILRVMFTAGLFDHPKTGGGQIDTPAQRAVARRAATEGIVLLKNEGSVLPLKARGRTIAVIGPSAAALRTGGGGSSFVQPQRAVCVVDGIKAAAGADAKVEFAEGCAMEGEKSASARSADELRQDAVALAQRSECAVVVVGNSRGIEAEGFDRTSMDLPAGQDELIAAVAAANPRTIVVVIAGSPVTMTRWLDQVKAVVFAWYGGQDGGSAIGDVLLGRVNPSGKTPVSFPRRWQDATAYGNYPGDAHLHVTYGEGIYVGYRGFDRGTKAPLFPFGFGLSYTTFNYSGITATDRKVTFKLRNGGDRTGAEVAQVYVHPLHTRIDRPVKELKGFARVELGAGQSQRVTVNLPRSAFAYFDPTERRWRVDSGDYEIWVGGSSADIRLRQRVTVAGD